MAPHLLDTSDFCEGKYFRAVPTNQRHIVQGKGKGKMKSFLMTMGSVALSLGVVANAYYQKKQFYPSVVYITKSNPSMAVSALSKLKANFDNNLP